MQTDPKPLLTIFGSKKGQPVYTANRLLRWGTILLNYNFKLEYLPSRQTGHTDGLLRLVPSQSEPQESSVIASLRTDCEIKNMMLNMIRELPVTPQKIKREAQEDEFISATKQKIADKNQCIADIFSLCDNVLLYGERVVIPKTLQKRILKDFPADHPGKNRMKNLMQSYMYWPKMNLDISNTVDAYKGYALAAKAPPITYKPWPKTDQPWSRIHVDFAGPMEDIYYLIVVDGYTKWPEVLRGKRPTAGVAITFLHELFARFGVVDRLVSDNGTQFTSSDFKEFCDTFQIKHITTPPYHPRSNGLVERFVDTLKRALKKASGTSSEKALQQFLQVYRITLNPNTPDATSPAETMLARKIRPVFEKLLPKQVWVGPRLFPQKDITQETRFSS